MPTTVQSDIGPTVRLVIKHAKDAFVSQEAVDRQWQALNYADVADFARAIDEYDRFAELLRDCGAALEFLPQDEAVGLDSIYVRDAAGSDRRAAFPMLQRITPRSHTTDASRT